MSHIQINISKMDGDSKSSSSLEARFTSEAAVYVNYFEFAKNYIAVFNK
jgi:hypothetical protein